MMYVKSMKYHFDGQLLELAIMYLISTSHSATELYINNSPVLVVVFMGIHLSLEYGN